jgi:hypothetical protein
MFLLWLDRRGCPQSDPRSVRRNRGPPFRRSGSVAPTGRPALVPTLPPLRAPSFYPSLLPTLAPSAASPNPSLIPTSPPSEPSIAPSDLTPSPTPTPSEDPTLLPTLISPLAHVKVDKLKMVATAALARRPGVLARAKSGVGLTLIIGNYGLGKTLPRQ